MFEDGGGEECLDYYALVLMVISGGRAIRSGLNYYNALKCVRIHFARPRTNGFGLVCPVSKCPKHFWLCPTISELCNCFVSVPGYLQEYSQGLFQCVDEFVRVYSKDGVIGELDCKAGVASTFCDSACTELKGS